MKQLKNFLIKREQSQARLSFAKREKSRLLAKTLLTLVALLAVTTGAWADETPLLTIESTDYTSFKSGSMTFDDKVTVTFSNPVFNDGDNWGWFANKTASLLTVAGINGYTITSCKFYTAEAEETGYTVEGESPSVYLLNKNVYTDANQSVNLGCWGVTKIEVYGAAASASSGPEVAWDKTKNSGTFTMPGGNVTLEPEYYPQATVADGGVTAADADARATTDDPLVKVDATKLTGAKKLMYFVSNSGTAPAYDAEGWTDQLPTAEGFTQQGIVYVWYYPVGTDEGVDGATATYSDGDICLQSITARIAAAPTYAVTFAEGTDANEWKAEPAADVKKGQTVTVTYTGTKKVIGVKAEKKAAKPAAEGHALSASAVGEIVGSDGKAYAAADKDNLPKGVKAEALVCYVDVDGEHGLALAMADVKDAKMSWDKERGANDGKTAAEWCTGWNTSHPITGATWLLASKIQWDSMISAAGGASNLSNAFGAVGGTNLQAFSYWSSTPHQGGSAAWRYYFPSSSWSWTWLNSDNTGSYIRASLAW